MDTLAQMLEDYRNDERGLPSYEELCNLAAQVDTKELTDEQIIEVCERECGWLAGAKDEELIKFARAIAATVAQGDAEAAS